MSAQPPDCPACGAPVEPHWRVDTRCPSCDTPLRAAAEVAREAIAQVEATIASAALPERLRASLKARLFTADESLQAALHLGLTVASPSVVEIDEPAPEPIAEPTPDPETAIEPEPEPTPETAIEPEPQTVIPPEPVIPPRPVPSAPTLWQRLGPAFAENLLFFLGGFLLLAGALYFVSTAWTTMTGTAQLLLIEGGILGFGGLLVGAGHLLNRDRTLDDLDAVLATAGAGCTACAALAVGRLLHTDPWTGLGGIAAWAAAGVGIHTWALRRLRLFDPRLIGAALIAALGAIIAPVWAGWPVALSAACTGVGVWMAQRQPRWPISTLAFIAAAASAGQIALHTGAIGVLALPIVGAAWVYSRARQTLSAGHDLAAVGLAVAAVVLGLMTPNAALICAAMGAVVAGRTAMRRDNRGLLITALVLGLVAYVLLPAPIRGVVLALKAKAAAGLGYAGGRLPLAWYGVTCLPYVALCGWVARRLAADRPALARWARGWVLGVAAGLCVLAFTTTDLRAPLLVLPAEGLLLLGLAFWLRAPRMGQVAPLLLASAPVLAMLHFDWPFASATLGIAALVLASRLCLPREGAAAEGVHQSAAGVLLVVAALTAIPAVWADQTVHALDLLVAPLVVVAAWRLPRLRPLALLGLHRVVPALVGATGGWTWPLAVGVAIAATVLVGGHKRDRLKPLSGWALLAVAVLSGAYTLPFGIDATIGLLGAAGLGVALAWGTGHSPLAAAGLLCFAGAAASVGWIADLRPSRIALCAALALSSGIVALGELQRRQRVVYERIGWAPATLGLILGLLALMGYIAGNVVGAPRDLALLGGGLWAAMGLAPREVWHRGGWTLAGLGALWALSQGIVGVLPWMPPPGLAAMGAAALLRGSIRWLPHGWHIPAKTITIEWAFIFFGLLECAQAVPATPLSALPLIGALALTLTRRSPINDALTIAALALAVAGPLLAPWCSLDWAPIAIFGLASIGLLLRRFAWAPRGFEGLALVAGGLWIAAHGLDLALAVIDAQARLGGWVVGAGWIALAITVAAALGRRTPIRLTLAAPLLWWAPVALLLGDGLLLGGGLGDGPVRAAPSIALLALVACLRKNRPPQLWTHLLIAAGLTLDLWPHALVPGTAVGAALAVGVAAWRYRHPLDVHGTPWLIAGAGVLIAAWSGGDGPTPWHWIAIALAGSAWLAALIRGAGVSVGTLSGAALLIVAFRPIDGWGLGVAVAVAAAPWVQWGRSRSSPALGGAMYALAAALPIIIAFVHGSHLTPAVVRDAMVGIAGVALLAAVLRRSTPTVGVIGGLALSISAAATHDPRALAVALLAGAALVVHGRRHAWALEAAFAPFAYAAALAVGLGLKAPLHDPATTPWIAAAIGGIACVAAVAGRARLTVLGLIGAAAWISDLRTAELGTACAAALSGLALGWRALRTRMGTDAAWAVGSVPFIATSITGWALGLAPHWPLYGYAAGYLLLTVAGLIRTPQAGWRVFTAALLAGAAAVLLAGLGDAGLPMGWAGAVLLAGGIATLVFSGPLLRQTPRAIHGIIALGMLLHWALAQATPWLRLLDGHHLEVWVSLAAVAAALAPHLPDRLSAALPPYFYALPLCALLAADDAGTIARIAFLSALTLGLRGRQGKPGARYLAFALANVGAWAFWFDLGLFDPTLYGLPPGLTLLALAELERGRLSTKAHLGLLASGFALAYGGIAVQIITAGGALHAALLLVGGLISVGVGWRARRADLLIGGTAAVVLDVICYLARHGFQQSFISAGLLLFAGATVLLVATVAARMRRSAS